MTEEKSPMHELALGWVDFGAKVFPCRNADGVGENYATGEFEPKLEKTPLITSGLNGASNKDNIVNRWWRKFPDAIPGIPTGASSGFWILDVDVPSDKHKEDGRIWIDEMTAIHGDLPKTKICQTANGGYQYFFKHVDGVKNGSGRGKEGGLGKGVDVRGDGGYIIAPGSVMGDGRFYEWIDNDSPVADAPQWLLDIVIGKSYAPKSVDGAGSKLEANGNQARAYGLSVLEAEANVLASETEGGRGAAANNAAFNCGGLAEHCGISYSEIEAALYAACVANGLVRKDGENKVMRDLKRQITAGMRKPRSAPELKKKDKGNERSITVSGLNKIAQKAKERAARPDWDQSESDSYSSAVEEEDEDEARLVITPWDYSHNSEDLEMRDRIMPPHLTRRQVGLTLAAGGVGKTTNTCVEILSLVTGKDLLGYKPKRKYKVWWFNLEDPRDELDKKIWGVINYYKLDLKTVQEGLFVDSGREQDLRVAIATKNDPAAIDEEIVDLTRILCANRINLCPDAGKFRFCTIRNLEIVGLADASQREHDTTNLLMHLANGTAERPVKQLLAFILGDAKSLRKLNRLFDKAPCALLLAARGTYFTEAMLQPFGGALLIAARQQSILDLVAIKSLCAFASGRELDIAVLSVLPFEFKVMQTHF